MADTYDRSSKLKIDGWDLDQAKFVKSNNKIAVRVSNADGDALLINESILLPTGFVGISDHGSITSLAASTLTDVHIYTVPVGKTLILSKIECSGQNQSKFIVDIDGVTHGVKRTYWGNFNVEFEYSNLELPAGTVIKVKTIHERPDVSDYEARIIGVQG